MNNKLPNKPSYKVGKELFTFLHKSLEYVSSIKGQYEQRCSSQSKKFKDIYVLSYLGSSSQPTLLNYLVKENPPKNREDRVSRKGKKQKFQSVVKLKSFENFKLVEEVHVSSETVSAERKGIWQRFYLDLDLPCYKKVCQPIGAHVGYVVCSFI